VEASSGAEVPPDDPSVQRVDAIGRTPDQSVLALIDSLNRSDWRAAYSSFASPSVDATTASREWAAEHLTYVDFRVLETRVDSAASASVHVTYALATEPTSSVTQPVVYDEWWGAHKVDGVWKTQWMPRQ